MRSGYKVKPDDHEEEQFQSSLEDKKLLELFIDANKPIKDLATLKRLAIQIAIDPNDGYWSVYYSRSGVHGHNPAVYDYFIDPNHSDAFKKLQDEIKAFEEQSQKFDELIKMELDRSGTRFNDLSSNNKARLIAEHSKWKSRIRSLLSDTEKLDKKLCERASDRSVSYMHLMAKSRLDFELETYESFIKDEIKRKNEICDQIRLEYAIDEAKSYIKFIQLSFEQRAVEQNLDDYRAVLKTLSFKKYFSENFTTFFLLPMVFLSEWVKKGFSYSLGLHSLITYLEGKFSIFTEWELPTLTYNFRYKDFEDTFIGLATISYPVNMANMFFLPFNYFFRNVGKIMGSLIGLIVGIIIFPFTLGKTIVEYASKIDERKLEREGVKNKKNKLETISDERYRLIFSLIDTENLDQVWVLYHKMKKMYPERAEDIFDKITTRLKIIAPHDEKAHYVLGKLYDYHGMKSEACLHYCEIDPKREDFLSIAFESLSYIYVSKKYGSAVKFLDKLDTLSENYFQEKSDKAAYLSCMQLGRNISAVLAGKSVIGSSTGFVVVALDEDYYKKLLSLYQARIYRDNCQTGLCGRAAIRLSAEGSEKEKLPTRDITVHYGVKFMLDEMEKVRLKQVTAKEAYNRVKRIAASQLNEQDGYIEECELGMYRTITMSA